MFQEARVAGVVPGTENPRLDRHPLKPSWNQSSTPAVALRGLSR